MLEAGNYEVTFNDVDNKPKRIRMFLSMEMIEGCARDGFRYICGYEKRGEQNVLRLIRFGENQTFSIEAAR